MARLDHGRVPEHGLGFALSDERELIDFLGLRSRRPFDYKITDRTGATTSTNLKYLYAVLGCF